MKKISLLIVMFIISITTVSASTGTVYCPDDDDPVNVRNSVGGSVIGSMACQSNIEVLELNVGKTDSCSNWYKVRQGILTGYACGNYIKLNTPSTVSDGKVLCIEDTSPLGLWSDVNKTSKLAGLSCNTKIKILEKDFATNGKCSTSWYKIQYGSTIGYSCGKYIEQITEDIDLNTTDLKEYKENLKKSGFSDSYLDDLVRLHSTYPNWKFIPYETNLDFNTILNKEYDGYYKGWSLIEDYYGNLDGLKSVDSWSYNYFTNVFSTNFSGGGSNWYAASKEVIAYYMDPRNFLNEKNIFMFEDLSYNPLFHTREGIENMLKNTFMENKYADNDKTKTYADAFLDAGIKYEISPYVLISRVIQEIGASGSTIVSGTVEGYEGYYNFYNIGASASGGDKDQTIKNGLEYAKKEGWDSPYKAVVGGASFLGNNYVKAGQKTEYLQKWDLVGPSYVDHQYMQNIQAPYSQSYKTYNGYSSTNLLNSEFIFYIPTFKNMPSKTEFPNTGNPNNYLSSLTVNNKALFTSPTNERAFNIEVESDVTSVSISATKVSNSSTISGLGSVALNSDNTKINLTVTAENGSVRNYTINVTRKPKVEPDPEPEEPIQPEEPEPIKVSVKEVLDKAGIKAKDNYLYGFEVGKDIKVTLDKLKNAASDVTITSSKTSGLIASGDKIKIKTNNEEKEYTVIIYGDVNGDGKILPTDYVKIKNHIMDVKKLTSYELESADVNRDGKILPTDYVKIKNHIMDVSKISQE